MEGIDVNEETIALDTIKNVGIRGVYLMEENTLDNLRSGEHIELEVSNGANYEVWDKKGAKGSAEKARDIIKEILSKGNKSPLERSVVDKLTDIIKEYE